MSPRRRVRRTSAVRAKRRTTTAARLDRQVVPGISLRDLEAWAAGVNIVPRSDVDVELLSRVGRAQLDSYASPITGIGEPATDKRLSHHIRVPTISYQEAIEIYRGDKMARRAIEAPILECFRQGYELTISDEGKFDDLKEAVEEKIEELELNAVIQRARFYERAFGGSAILIGANDGRPLDQPLDLAKVTSIDWLNVLEPIELVPVRYYESPSAPKYGEVELYELQAFTVFSSASTGRVAPPPIAQPQPRIHASRLVVFPGVRVSRYQVQTGLAGPSWGDSVLTALIDALRDFNVSWSAAGLLAVDFGQPVISVKSLMQLVARNPGDFLARMRALEQGRSTARAILVDAEKEKFERQGTTLTGFPELLNALSMRLAAVVDMPLTLLMGQSPQGIGNDGTSDVRFYYDRIRGMQTTEIGPLLKWFIRLIMRTIRQRKLPKKWCITWAELWQMTEAEKAEARLTQARTDSMMIKSGVLYPDEVRKSRYRGGYSWDTQIDEHKKAPGFVTPPPAGTPGSTQNPGAATGPNAHTVGGYTRRNPTTSGTEPAPKQGGDVVPSNRDAAERRGVLIDLASRLRATDPRAAVIADQIEQLANAA